MDKEALFTLERWVLQEKRPVTARLLAVKQNIHIDKARACMKHLLESGSNSEKDKVHAHWMVIGAKIASESSKALMSVDGEESAQPFSQETMLLVDDDRLSEAKSQFSSSPQVILYALSPPLPGKPTSVHRIAATSQLSTIQHDLKNTVEYVKAWEDADRGVQLGAIQPAKDVTFIGKGDAVKTGLVAAQQQAASTNLGKNGLNAVQGKSDPAAKSTTSTSKAGTLSFAPSSSTSKAKKETASASVKKEEKKDDDAMDVDDEEDDGPIGYADPLPTEKVVSVPKEAGGASHKRADAGDAKSKQEDLRRRRKQELIDMMDEDRDGNADPEVEKGASTSTSMMGPAKGQKTSKDTKVDESSTETQGPPSEKRRVRKQRKVTRKETTKDAKGYRVTRDVDAYESYSSFESSDEEEGKGNKTKKATTSSGGKGGGSKVKAEDARVDTKVDSTEKLDEQVEEATEAKTFKRETKEPPTAPAPTAPPPSSKKTTSGGSGQQKLSSFFTRKV